MWQPAFICDQRILITFSNFSMSKVSQETDDFPHSGGTLTFHLPKIKGWAALIIEEPTRLRNLAYATGVSLW